MTWMNKKPVVEMSELVMGQWSLEKGEVVMTGKVEQVSMEQWSLGKEEVVMTEEVEQVVQEEEEVVEVNEMVVEDVLGITKTIMDQRLLEKKERVEIADGKDEVSDKSEVVNKTQGLVSRTWSDLERSYVSIKQTLPRILIKQQHHAAGEVLTDELTGGVDVDTHDHVVVDQCTSVIVTPSETRESFGVVGEVIEEEIVELEFEEVKPKLNTHSMHCPNCKAKVTKVILHRKVLNYQPVQKPVVVVEPQSHPNDLVGSFSFLSLFTCSDNGCFNPFDIFRKRPDTTDVPTSSSNGAENAKLVVQEKDNCLSMFWVFGKEQKQPDPVLPDKYVTGTASIPKGQLPSSSEGNGATATGASTSPSNELPPSPNAEGDGDIMNEVETETAANASINMDSNEANLVISEAKVNQEITYTGKLRLGYQGASPSPSYELPPSPNAEGDGDIMNEVETETANASINMGSNEANLVISKAEVNQGASTSPSYELPPSPNAEGDGDIMNEVETETAANASINMGSNEANLVISRAEVNQEITDTGRLRLGYQGAFAEILKSIVYGGLMEVIASLSVVASAAASDAATPSIVALALASIIVGVLVHAHNLWDLRDDCHKESSTEVTNSEATNKYKELLGRVEYFPLHAFFAILSFLVFGMVPPIAYRYSFHKTNDKDYMLVVVSVASLLCVSLLALFKAYINKCTVLGYFKTVAYYITTAVSVSGVSYVAGNLVTRLMEEYGLFDTSSGGGVSLLPHATTPSLASF